MNSDIGTDDFNRQSLRFKGYDYSLPGAYFVTTISKRRVCLFGEVRKGNIVLSDIGRVVEKCWHNISKNFPYVRLDEFVLMPNHLHGILFLFEAKGKGEAFSAINTDLDDINFENASPLRPHGTQSRSLGSVIQNFKSVSTRMVNRRYFKAGNKIWQRNYFERIIRNDRELYAIRQYIRDNPLNWRRDLENPTNI